MIVVEGGDNVGKTTLIRQLCEMDPKLFVLDRQRFSPSNGGSIGQSYLDMLFRANQKGRGVQFGVADRLLASEVVYGTLFRGGSRITERESILIRAMLISYGAIIVHCDPPNEAVVASWKDREQLYDRDPLIITNEYRRVMSTVFAPMEVIRYDWTRDTAPAERQFILDLHHEALEQYHFPTPREKTNGTT